MKTIHNVNKLLSPWIRHTPDKLFKNIISDSRKITYNDLFIAVKGNIVDGSMFISQAINKGASIVLLETNKIKYHGLIQFNKKVPIIHFFNLSRCLPDISGRFYQNPGKKITTVGVTGTNGKTTVTHLIAQWAHLLGEKTAIIGTLGNGLYKALKKTPNTTDSAIVIQSLLHKFIQKKVNLVTIEVSSHGIQENRIKNIFFKIGILTNISQDHLDYHKNIQEYTKTKWNFFKKNKVYQKILNNDDKTLNNNWYQKNKHENDILINTQQNINNHFSRKQIYAKKIIFDKNNTKIFFHSYWGNGVLISQLLGLFNVNNILLAFSSLLKLGYPMQDLVQKSHLLSPIPGRMHIINRVNQPIIIIDFAHTPDALKKVLQTLRYYYYKKKIWCIFGCGGNKDVTKRSKMGIIAEQLSNQVIVTNDNPRNENPIKIANDIVRYCTKNVKIIIERKEAITYAIKLAKKNDIILIAGKGIENYQIIGNKFIQYSDINTVFKILNKK
ncbi:UDP-N-acetylmuramoyl-L-alanyl-D-glutamate--2,6-diaminopimelate ligase [Buchnera aphidicola (Nipponaphis monzeni)]|uniref:UDP-N-acetylmuramoyl-L-alanyl-D-glutamate--2,6-diaminopimelate ligase n=1 Tax=Buchnera aphidicola (Nipponaphis monzeni) TaxID=2495405 RepID=A0A455TA40_9GAMM|nr:UDP-N-acetylmuramoyl-L-alanyl-D-glutamate--2,6-diaminopimelate ligase [Buchnera aphidicola]BBI01189.1 UDP-N-acetylmuramoyl-L-alanyl-D-glutamate--2,6-diaminopimelate ligase [Buchnera aphidicola (Nipponaphis monzeni)]